MRKKLSLLALSLSVLSLVACGESSSSAKAQGEPVRPECIAPAKPGGGLDLTCKLAQSGFKDTGILTKPMRVTYMPGGVGAVAYNKIVANDRANGDAIIAFSTGSILNLSQGKFGKYTEKDVRWLAAVGADYGALAVSVNSPIKDLADLAKALKKDSKAISFAGGGSVGGQDWVQTAIFAKAVGVDPTTMTYVAMEGGGEAITAAMGGHISVISAGIAELMPQVNTGKLRVLAVFAEERLEGMDNIPTALEQGYEVLWPVIRGFYVGPEVSEASYQWWKTHFETMLADPKFAEIRKNRELFPFAMTGEKLEQYVYKRTKELRELSTEYHLITE